MQTQLERDAAHLESTSQLIIDVLEAQKIPTNIAIGAMWRAVMDITIKESKTAKDLMISLRTYIEAYDESVPLYLYDHLREYLDKLAPDKKIAALVALLNMAPERVIINDGKIVDVRS